MSGEDLALAVKARRADLGLTKQAQITDRGGPSLGVLRNIETAAQPNYAATTLIALDRALEWERGSSAALLATGKAPVVVVDRKALEDEHAMRIGYALIALIKEVSS